MGCTQETPAPVHPGDAAQPVSEGLDKTERTKVKTTAPSNESLPHGFAGMA
jgi:hypothetical protein